MNNLKNFEIYNYSGIYNPATISVLPSHDNTAYAHKLLDIKLGLVSKYILPQSRIVDLGCGNGLHLTHFSKAISFGYGVDFSARFIQHAIESAKQKNIYNLDFINCSFEDIKIDSNTIDLIYSFSSLYYVIKNIEKVFKECFRVLKKDGIAVLDLGNTKSLNKLVCNQYPNIAEVYSYNIDFLLSALCQHFIVLEHRSFQFFPMWGDKPWYLKPLLTSFIPAILKFEVGGKMLDEWLSSLPYIKKFAFRHLIVLRKKSDGADA